MQPPPPDPSPTQAPPRRKSALAFFGVVLLLFLPGMLAQVAVRTAGLVWSEVFAFLLPALVATAGSNLRAGAYLKLRRPRGVTVGLGALVGGAGYLLAVAVLLLVQRVVPHRWVELFDPTRIFEGPAWERIAVAAIAVLVAPPCEEIAFRGYVQTTLALRRPSAVAIAVSGALFAAMHLDPVRFPALFLLGSVFGWLAWRSGSIWPSVAAHATNNAITSILFLLSGPDTAPEAALPSLATTLGIAAGGVAALALLLRAFRAATPPPAEPEAALALRDPAEPSIGFSAARVPRALRIVSALGIAALLAVLLAGGAGAGRPRRPARPTADPGAPVPAEPRGGTRGGAPPGSGS